MSKRHRLPFPQDTLFHAGLLAVDVFGGSADKLGRAASPCMELASSAGLWTRGGHHWGNPRGDGRCAPARV